MQDDDDNKPIDGPGCRLSHADAARTVDHSLYFVLLAAVGFLLARIPLLAHRFFDPDEFEHSHTAWCLSKGMIPYKDFFEHHTPWYYFALAPLFHWFEVDVSFESARHFLLFGRALSFVLTVLSVFLVCRLGCFWQDRRAGLTAGFLLVGQPIFLQKTIEMRPDVLALPFFVGALWLLLRGLAESEGSRQRLRWFAFGGLSLGAAIMCTQKMLFALPGLVAGLGVFFLSRRRRSRMLEIVAFLVGVAVPGMLTWAVFGFYHAGGAFIINNFLLNARWTRVETGDLPRVLQTSAPVLALSLLGIWLAVRRSVRSKQGADRDVLLLCTLLGLSAGVPVIPVAYRQYYLMPLPIVSLFAAEGLLWLVDRVREGARGWAFVLSIIPLSVLPVLALRDSFKSSNEVQLARLRHVFESTKRTDLVMDGWEGTGVFRPHAFYYFFIHDEVLPLARERVDAYLDDVEGAEGRKARPRLIALDKHLVALGPRFVKFVKNRYVSSDGFLYFTKN